MSNVTVGALLREQSVLKVTTRWVMTNQTDGTKGVAKVVQFHLSRGVILRHQSFHWRMLYHTVLILWLRPQKITPHEGRENKFPSEGWNGAAVF